MVLVVAFALICGVVSLIAHALKEGSFHGPSAFLVLMCIFYFAQRALPPLERD